ncbi:MAG: hypothetical protein R3C49_15280 [Planctomycetaceae bacterium]
MKTRHIILGALSWLTVFLVGWLALRAEVGRQSGSVTHLISDVSQWLTGRSRHFAATSELPVALALNDPVFLQNADGTWRHAGLVTNINGSADRDPLFTDHVDLQIYDNAIAECGPAFRLEYHTTPMALDWVAKTMLPKERQAQIAARIVEVWAVQQAEVMAEVRPVIQEGLQTALRSVEAELPSIIARHRQDFRNLGGRYETEILKAEILPLVKEEILPIVEEESIPVAKEIGSELWKRVSLWSFTWRFVYDRSPLPRKDAVRQEFDRFIQEEALPELRSRTDQFIEVTETIVRRSMENPRVKTALRENLKRVAEDPELHQLIAGIVREAVIENQTLKQELNAWMKAQETKAALQLAGDRLEPLVREIGDMIFGSREKGITPEFSRVLRAQILMKDRRWLVIVPDFDDGQPHDQIPIDVTGVPMIYPLGFGGTAQSPLTPQE